MYDSFLQYLQFEKRYSEHTLIAYRKDLSEFAEFYGEENLAGVSPKDVRNWMVCLIEDERKSSTVNRKLSTLRTYFDWLLMNGELKTSPMKLIRGPKKEKRLPVFVRANALTQEKISEIVDSGSELSLDRVMIEVFYQTGIRLSELISLTWEQVRLDHIRVLGKRNKERLIPISTDLYQAIQGLNDLKISEAYAQSEYVFSLKNGKKYYPSLVYRKINNYLSKASDVSKRSPHVLRHTFATHLLNNGAGLEVIKELLGHSGLAATQVYTHNSFAEINKIYSQAHPRGRK